MAQSYVYAHPGWYARHGYGVVVQDSRGRGSSAGDFYPLRGDAADGVDTIAWCAEQPWCSGKVASYGFSLPGLNQLLAAAEKPAALVTAIPGFYPQGMYDGLTHVGGAFGLAAVLNWALLLAPDAARRAGKPELLNDISNASGCGGPPATLALKDMPFLLKPDLMSFLRDYLEHPAFGPYWREFELGEESQPTSPSHVYISPAGMTASSHRRWMHTSDLQPRPTRIIGCWSDRGTTSPGRSRSVPSISATTRETSSTSINSLGSTSGPKASAALSTLYREYGCS